MKKIKKRVRRTIVAAAVLCLAGGSVASAGSLSLDSSSMSMEMPSLGSSGSLDAPSLGSSGSLDAPSLGSSGKSLSGQLKDAGFGDFGDMSLDLEKKSLDVGSLSTGSSSGDLKTEGLKAGDLNAEDLDVGSLGSADADSKKASIDGSDSKTSDGAWKMGSVDMKDLEAEMPTLEGFKSDIDVSGFMPGEKTELEMPSLDSLRGEMSESMKSNATSTLKETFGSSFTSLDSNLFGTSNMPEISFESLNVEYASLISEFQSEGYGSKFKLGELPKGGSADETMKGLEKKTSEMGVSSDSEYADMMKNFKKQGYGKQYSLTTPSTGKSISASSAKDVFNQNYGNKGSGVQTLSIPSSFNPSGTAMTKSRTNRGNAFGEFRNTAAYSGFLSKSSMKQTALNATAKMNAEFNANKSYGTQNWGGGKKKK